MSASVSLNIFPPHLCVGLLFLVVHSRPLPLPLPASRRLPPPNSHTTLSHTHNLLTHKLLTPLTHTHSSLTHTQLTHTHTQLSHTGVALVDIVHFVRRRGTWQHPFGVAGVALGDIELHFVWQAWHLAASTFILCGRCGLALVTRLGPVVAVVAAAVCVACECHLAAFSVIWRGRHGTW